MKYCQKCEEYKNNAEFPSYNNICRACINQRLKVYYYEKTKNPRLIAKRERLALAKLSKIAKRPTNG